MKSLNELKEYGTTLGLEGDALLKFVNEQQAKMRDESQAQREREREKEAHALKLMELEHSNKVKLLEMEAETNSKPQNVNSISSAKSPKLPPFEEGKDEIDAYLHRFERYAISQKWDRQVWATHISALLKGDTLNVYALLPIEKALDYDELKSALINRFDMTEDGFKQKFRTVRPEIGETFQQYSVRLKSYFKRWIEMAGIGETFEGLFDLIVRDQFLHVCSNELTLFLKERVPDSLVKMATLADQYREARRVIVVSLTQIGKKVHSPVSQSNKSVGGDFKGGIQSNKVSNKSERRCFKCNKAGHLIFECPMRFSKVQASNFQSVGPGFSGDPPRRFDRGQNRYVDNRPTTCGAFIKLTNSVISTHSELPSATVSVDSGLGLTGGMPVVKGKVGEHVVHVLRDTGCSGVVIRKDLVSSKLFEDELQTCILADGTSISVPVAKVSIDTPYFTGEVRAWCVEKPIYDVILGNIPGARDPNNPNREKMIHVLTRQQKRKEKEPYTRIKVPDLGRGDISPDDIRNAQSKDETLVKVHRMAKEGKAVEKANGAFSKYFFKNKILFREYMSPKVKKGKVFHQLVVPNEFREIVMKLAHESLMAGHLAAKRSLDRIQVEFYWPGMQMDIKRFCKSCDICQRTVQNSKLTKAPLGKMPVIDAQFKRVAVDIVGPLEPRTSKGNKYILTLADYATRYPEAVPLPSIETERVAEALIEIFCRVGFPQEILTDMGSQFTPGLMGELCRLVSVKQLSTTPYHPMCNGLVERFNGTLKQMLRRMCAERPKDWDKYLGPALFAYREVPQESVRFSPFELIYAWPVRGPMSILKELWTKDIENPEIRNVYQYVIDLRERLESTCELVRQNLEAASQKQSKLYNKKAKPRKYKIRNKVLVLLPTKSNKLLMQRKGPFIVVDKQGDLDYKIEVKGKSKVFHLNLLKLYVEREKITGNCSSVSDNTVLNKIAVAVVDLADTLDGSKDDAGEIIEPPHLCFE